LERHVVFANAECLLVAAAQARQHQPAARPNRLTEAHCFFQIGPVVPNSIYPCHLFAPVKSKLAGLLKRIDPSYNLTPADVYFGCGLAILDQRARIKRQTIEHRRLQHRKLAA